MRKRPDIQDYILKNVRQHPSDIVKLTSERFKMTRQGVHRHIKQLVEAGGLSPLGKTNQIRYVPVPKLSLDFSVSLSTQPQEDKVWRQNMVENFSSIPKNVVDICQYGFTEIFNNAVDHSDGTTIHVKLEIFHDLIAMRIADDGVGIFNKIQRIFNLEDPLHAILELSKGKLSTDPKNHTGEGIFFSSRMFDSFTIFSSNYCFHYSPAGLDWMLEDGNIRQGTEVVMEIDPGSPKTSQEVFNQFSTHGDLGFDKTIFPVFLARYGSENFISRSQARRLMSRSERFRTVVLDFDKVDMIGQAFADEIFRVFQNEHPDITLVPVNDTEDIANMIKRVKNQA